VSGGPRVLIVGATGQLGGQLERSFAGYGTIVAARRGTIDLLHDEQIRKAIRDLTPEIIINAAAYTAVDKAESEPSAAMAINGHAPGVLAEEAMRCGALLVHYSTDYVFDGAKSTPWIELDPPHPLNVYGASKLAGEEAVRRIGGRYLIFRTSWVYGPKGHNFLFTMLRLGRERSQLHIVDDQIGAPTTSVALADATRTIVEKVIGGASGDVEDWAGLYHMTCGGMVSWCGFAREIFRRAEPLLSGKAPQVTPIASSEYPTPAKRPSNSVLSCHKLEARFGLNLPEWETALDAVLAGMSTESNH
jgi:dTDP-4-dehydrorhamnose reductase